MLHRHKSCSGVARELEVPRTTIYYWIRKYGLQKQEVPVEDKKLMIELFYQHNTKPTEIVRIFKDEIPSLNLSKVISIVKPRLQYKHIADKRYALQWALYTEERKNDRREI